MKHGINYKWILTVFTAIFVANNAFAANYPLEITNIKPVGTGTPVMTDGNRIFKAYPGIAYNIRAAVIGGVYPYRYVLTQKPEGMIIDSLTGVINWPNPQTDAKATLMVTDCENTKVSVTWAIAVTKTGFIFINSSVETSGNGSIESPFKSMKYIMGENKYDATYNKCIVYFRGGTYDLEGYYDNPASPVRVAFYSKPAVWMAYPGEKVILDFKKQNISQLIDNIYQENFEIKNCGNYGFDQTGNYSTYRNLYFHNLVDITGGSNNQSFLTLRNYGYATFITDCIFDTLTAGCDIKLYGQVKCLIDNNTIRNNTSTECIAVKATSDSTTIRNNFISNMPSTNEVISINAYAGSKNVGCRNNEILFNIMRNCPIPMVLGNELYLGLTYVHDNILEGTPQIHNVTLTQGPVYFYHNTIQNNVTNTGDTTSNRYYRDKVMFNYSPGVYKIKVLISNAVGVKDVKNGGNSPFLPIPKTLLTNSTVESYDFLGKLMLQSAKHKTATAIVIKKQDEMSNMKCVLLKK